MSETQKGDATAPRDGSYVRLHSELGDVIAYWDAGTHQWRNVHGEVAKTEGVVTWTST